MALSRKAEKLKQWYLTYERPVSTAALIGGFVFDAVTLKRVDLFWENTWVLAHLITAAIAILLLNMVERKRIEESVPGKYHFWLLLFIQFSFGGLLSTFLVYYFRSSTLATSWPFLLLLAVTFAGNERFRNHYSRLTFQISVLFISIFSFSIFIVPIVFMRLGTDMFLFSGLISLEAIAIFILAVQLISNERFKKSRWYLAGSIFGIYAIINILYFTHLIPPIPLSLKDAGVFHGITKDGSGNYVAAAEPSGFWDFLRSSTTFHIMTGERVYVFSAVFSPTNLNTDIVHNWQHYNEATQSWQSVSKVTLPINGGRDGGYRTYSYKSGLEPGRWRVDVETPQGADIGRIAFNIVHTDTEPAVVQETH